MNIYLDFESTQFGEYIIAIGAYTHMGEFKCFVKPPNQENITPFITQLTGITKTDLSIACEPEEAFGNFLYWISHELYPKLSINPIPFFHVFGDGYSECLKNTAKHIDDIFIQEFVINLANSLIDDSKEIRKFFHAKSIGLYKAFRYFNPTITEQEYNPVKNAKVLCKLMEMIAVSSPPKIYPYEDNLEALPDFNIDKNEIILGFSKIHPDAEPKKFYSEEAVVKWAYDKIKKNSPSANMQRVKQHLIEAIKTNGEYLGRTWEIRLTDIEE